MKRRNCLIDHLSRIGTGLSKGTHSIRRNKSGWRLTNSFGMYCRLVFRSSPKVYRKYEARALRTHHPFMNGISEVLLGVWFLLIPFTGEFVALIGGRTC